MLNSERSPIPEYRAATVHGLAVDLSPDDLLVYPLEPVGSGSPESAHRLSRESEDIALAAVLGGLIQRGDRVLLFEPTRPDIRQAILHVGASYIDGGRLLHGVPDPAVLQYFRERQPDLIVVEMDDVISEDFTVPVLVDSRAQPYDRGVFHEGRFTLCALSRRDGFSDSLGVWLQDASESTGSQGVLAGAAPSVFAALEVPGFSVRAAERCANVSQSLQVMLNYAETAGFEVSCRAGYLWLGLAGFTAMEIQLAFRNEGVGVFACSHHPYRHRVRLAPPDLKSIEEFKLIFLPAYKSLTSCD